MPLPTTQPGEITPGLPLAEARQVTSEAIGHFVTRRNVRPARGLVVRSSPGTGKTHALAAAVNAQGVRARVLVGTKQLATEQAARHGYARIEGRNPANCTRHDVVEALAMAGHPIGPNACGTVRKPRCPHRANCPYFAQFNAPGAWIGATEQLYNANFLRGGELIAIDDGDLLRAAFWRTRIDAPVLHQAIERIGRHGDPAVVRTIQIVAHALVEPPAVWSGGGTGALTGASGWDHVADLAARHGEDVAALVAALPARAAFPTLAGDGVLELEAVGRAVPADVDRLLDVLRDELSAFVRGEPFNSHLRWRAHGLDLAVPREHVRGQNDETLVGRLPMLILDAASVDAVLEHVLRHHQRLPDIKAVARIPDGVEVVQYATAPNGHTGARRPSNVARVLQEIEAERRSWPVGEGGEGVVALKFLRPSLEADGVASQRIATYGSARGLNTLADVERLHVIGRPMPPVHELVFVANVLHHGELSVSDELVLRPQPFGGQRWQIDVLDFADARVSALLRAHRDDEMWQMLHRARPADVGETARRRLRVVLHTSHPIPGLRVDELVQPAVSGDLNVERRADAEARIWSAAERLWRAGGRLTITTIAREARSHKRTVRTVLGTSVQTVIEEMLVKGVHRVPHTRVGDGDAGWSVA